jgi:hypothetical protein
MDEYIITGEKLQGLASIYIGSDYDFMFNPNIFKETKKQFNIKKLEEILQKSLEKKSVISNIDNPKKIFCYPTNYNLALLSKIIPYFNNNFILITHNSDYNVVRNNINDRILNSEKLIQWFSQNVSYNHNKLYPLPIGLANSQWEHGNLSWFENMGDNIKNLHKEKTHDIYFNFEIGTNKYARQICYDKLKDKIPFLEKISPIENMIRLSKYKFCVCPEGNGVDTHRLWEALYLQTIPIVLRTPFVIILQEKLRVPLVILNSWDELDVSLLNYEEYTFGEKYFNRLSFDKFKNIICNL